MPGRFAANHYEEPALTVAGDDLTHLHEKVIKRRPARLGTEQILPVERLGASLHILGSSLQDDCCARTDWGKHNSDRKQEPYQ